MDFDSFLYSGRTTLSSLSSSAPPWDITDDSPHDPTPADPNAASYIWTYLLSLTQDFVAIPQLQPGKLKHYKLTDFNPAATTPHIGEGACYRVDRHALHSGALVAIKRLKIFGAADVRSDSIATILKELHVLTHPPIQLHPNIAGLLGYSSELTTSDAEDGARRQHVEISLVAQFAPYGTLKQFLAKGGGDIDLLTKARCMRDIASGLEALHACGIVQGDVKLDNTLVFDHPSVEGGYEVRLSDFGHAIVISDAMEKEVRYLGTSILNAPEVRTGSPSFKKGIGCEEFYKCDVFSYGLAVWEVLLDGARFLSTRDLQEEEVEADPLTWMNSLSRDELLRKSLDTLNKTTAGESEQALVKMLRQLLESTLRDLTDDRKTMAEVLQIFRAQKSLKEDAVNGPSPPYPSTLDKWSLQKAESSSLAFPTSVQADLVMQLQATTQNNQSPETLRRNAHYDLAMCNLTGFGVMHIDVDAGLTNLAEAALLGSPKALAVVVRLHDALDRTLPDNLKTLNHPIMQIERDLHLLPPESYFPERIRLFEKFYQQEALQRTWNVYHDQELLCTGALLTDVEEFLTLKNELAIDIAKLRCAWTQAPGDDELSVTEGLLLHVAARLGLLSLVEYLVSRAGAEIKLDGVISNDESPIISASRGGHLPILDFLLSKGSWPVDYDRKISAMHWLMMFPPGDVEAAFDKIQASRGGSGCIFTSSLPLPGMGVHFCNPSGVPLDIAVAINHVQLVQLLLPPATKKGPFTSRKRGTSYTGWGDDTFGLAIRCHHSQLIPVLLPHEVLLHRSQPLYKETALVHKAQGKRELKPFGLFEVGHTPPTISMLVMHGRHSQSALDATLDAIFEADICSLNDEDEDGSTALTHAIRLAPCDINTTIVSTLVSRGAKFGSTEQPEWILRICIAGRNDLAEGPIVRTLLESRVLEPTAELFTTAIRTADARIVAAFLEVGGEEIGVNIPFTEEEIAILPLHIAVMTPGNAQVVNLLLDHGADINARVKERTCLELAIAVPVADGEVIDALVARDASLESEIDTTIVHSAARVRSRVNGVHVLFHLLRHQKIRELVNTGAYGEHQLSPLHIACFTGDIEAVLALLEMEAAVPRKDEWGLLRVVEKIGRCPDLNPLWPIKVEDEEAVYAWRLTAEKIMLLLMDKADPGHGRTPLHVAAQLGNTRRVKQLVERGGMSAWTGDRDNVNALGMLEDVERLKERGVDEVYIKNIEELSDYLQLKIILEIAKTMDTASSLQDLLDRSDPSKDHSVENQTARLELQDKLADMKLNERHQKETIIKDGYESPEELEVRYAERIEKLKVTVGEDHPDTLEHMSKRAEILTMIGRVQEASSLQLIVLEKREETLTDKDELLYTSWSDRFRLLSALGKTEEAKVFAFSAVDKALAAFGDKHHVYLTTVYDTSLYYWFTGDYDKSIELHEQLLKTYPEISNRNDLETLQATGSLLYLYFIRQKYDDVSALVRDVASKLQFIKTEDFLDAFDCLVDSIAKLLDQCYRFEDSEPIYQEVLKTCLRLRGRKAYCTRTVIRCFANHYKARSLWEKEGAMLQMLLDDLRGRLGPDHVDTLKCILDLAQTYDNQQRWIEANGLLQQAVEALQKTVGHDHLETLRAKAALAFNWRQQDELEKAETVGWEAARGYRQVLGDDEKTTSTEQALAITLTSRGKLTEAIELQEKVLKSAIELHSEVHDDTRTAMENLSATLMRAKRLEEAEALCRRQIKSAIEMHGEKSLFHSHALGTLSTCVGLAGDNEQSIDLLIKAVDIEKGIHGEHNSNTLYSMRQMAIKYIMLEDYDSALDILGEIKSEGPRVYGSEDCIEHAFVYSHLGVIHERTSNLALSLENSKTALSIARKVYGDWNDATIVAIENVLRVLTALSAPHMLEEAYGLATEIYQYRTKTLGDHHVDTIAAAADLSVVCTALELWPETETLHRQILRGCQINNPDGYEDDEYITYTAMLVEVCNRQGRYYEAETAAKQVLSYRKRVLGEDAEDTIDAMLALSNVFVHRRNLEQAVELNEEIRERSRNYPEKLSEANTQIAYVYFQQKSYDRALELQLEILREDPENVDEQDFLFRIYLALERYEDAETLAAKSLAERRRIDPEAEAVWDTLSNMRDLYMKTNRFEEARRVGEEVLERREKTARRAAADLHVLQALMDMKEVYEALQEVEKVLEVATKIQRYKDAASYRRDAHAFRMRYADHLFKKELKEKGIAKRDSSDDGFEEEEGVGDVGEGSANQGKGKGKAMEPAKGQKLPKLESGEVKVKDGETEEAVVPARRSCAVS